MGGNALYKERAAFEERSRVSEAVKKREELFRDVWS